MYVIIVLSVYVLQHETVGVVKDPPCPVGEL